MLPLRADPFRCPFLEVTAICRCAAVGSEICRDDLEENLYVLATFVLELCHGLFLEVSGLVDGEEGCGCVRVVVSLFLFLDHRVEGYVGVHLLEHYVHDHRHGQHGHQAVCVHGHQAACVHGHQVVCVPCPYLPCPLLPGSCDEEEERRVLRLLEVVTCERVV